MYDGLDVRAVSAPPPPSHPTALVQQREICRLVRAADGLRGRPHAAACAPERPCAVCRPFATGMQAARLEAARADLAAARAAAPPRAAAEEAPPRPAQATSPSRTRARPRTRRSRPSAGYRRGARRNQTGRPQPEGRRL